MRCNARLAYAARMPHVTPTQLALIQEGVAPKRRTYGSGGGWVVADPRTIRALKDKRLAFPPGTTSSSWHDQRQTAWLTRLAYELVEAEPPKGKHPYDLSKEWP